MVSMNSAATSSYSKDTFKHQTVYQWSALNLLVIMGSEYTPITERAAISYISRVQIWKSMQWKMFCLSQQMSSSLWISRLNFDQDRSGLNVCSGLAGGIIAITGDGKEQESFPFNVQKQTPLTIKCFLKNSNEKVCSITPRGSSLDYQILGKLCGAKFSDPTCSHQLFTNAAWGDCLLFI